MDTKRILSSIAACFVLTSWVAMAAGDLKIKDIEIEPKPAGTQGPSIELGTYRSYRIIVTIDKMIELEDKTFMVRTECIRGVDHITLGEVRLGDSTGWIAYAAYALFPGEAGPGECLLRTTIDAENEIAESDESPLSNIWDRKAKLVGP